MTRTGDLEHDIKSGFGRKIGYYKHRRRLKDEVIKVSYHIQLYILRNSRHMYI